MTSTSFVGSVLALLIAASGAANAHWPGQPPHQMADLGDLKLESGAVIKNLRMSYVTHGKLSAAKDNAILFMHGGGANHHNFDHMIGPGRPLDTDRYFVICPDVLGATQTGYEHSTSPTNSGLKMKFPFFNDRDIVQATYLLVTQGLGIPHLVASTGISMGGRASVQLAISHPQFMDGIVPVVSAPVFAAGASATQGRFRGPLMVSSLTSCKGWDGGDYEQNPKACATNAISVVAGQFHTSEWWSRDLDTPEAYARWRSTFGTEYLDVQDARDLFYQMVAWGRSQMSETPGFDGDLNKALGSIKAKSLVIYSPRDQLSLAADAEALIRAIPNARGLAIDSPAGHFICCNADPQATRAMGEAISHFLRALSAQRVSGQ